MRREEKRRRAIADEREGSAWDLYTVRYAHQVRTSRIAHQAHGTDPEEWVPSWSGV
jgi:hypothetical protein